MLIVYRAWYKFVHLILHPGPLRLEGKNNHFLKWQGSIHDNWHKDKDCYLFFFTNKMGSLADKLDGWMNPLAKLSLIWPCSTSNSVFDKLYNRPNGGSLMISIDKSWDAFAGNLWAESLEKTSAKSKYSYGIFVTSSSPNKISSKFE